MNLRNIVLVLVIAALAGCAGKGAKEQEDLGYGTYSGQPGAAAGAQAGGVGEGGLGTGAAFDDSAAAGPRASMKNRTVYFDYDRDEVKPEFRQLIADHGRYLAANPAARVRLEGHADERGSREYNIGLGERRAQAVLQALLLQGAAASQVATVSYGEERPAVTSSDEESWSLNRRVEIVYAQ
ncbi:MAG: peptidoglycan-associated lipoprotein Pal [Gammaproteobacteria bacterium]|nr:MAG: peptidoglycan-associated lipoprotein Pal [Gammaproteobacteria bacterium]